MNRRDVLLRMLVSAAVARASVSSAQTTSSLGDSESKLAALKPSWTAWKSSFLTSEGRVVDNYQEGASHSESQGYGLYLALRFGDIDAFKSIYTWTESNLALRSDGLLAWRWKEDDSPHVVDTNNASDGDIFYAWSLMRGAERFNLPDAQERARQIAKSLEALCVDNSMGLPGLPVTTETLLLPGADGFIRGEEKIYNPSYWMPKFMMELGQFFSCPKLYSALYAGLNRLDAIAKTGLCPDWTAFNNGTWDVAPTGFSANAGYEAMRVPLYLCMSGMSGHPIVAQFRNAYRKAMEGSELAAPTVMSLNGDVIERSPHAGYAAIAGLVNCAVSPVDGPLIPLFTANQPYYPATLHMFALIAQIEGYPACIPI